MENDVLRDTVIQVDLSALAENMQMIRECVGPDVAVMPVVKANGYGHGAASIAPALLANGAVYLAVATLTEALELKKACRDYPVFILGHTPDRLLKYVVEYGITQTVFDIGQARLLDSMARRAGTQAAVHVKVDTGFHRLGKAPSPSYAEEIRSMFALENLKVEGIFSHLALAGSEDNEKQFGSFTSFVAQLADKGCRFRYQHIADSIALVDYPQYRLNMVRPGALVYGMRGFHLGFLGVRQALTFYTHISQLHHVPAGEGVSYDYLWKAPRDSIIATLPFGYADGYPRNLRDKGYVIIEGVKCPLVGVLCMDQVMADVTDVPGAKAGMKAVIYGDGQDGSMTVAKAAELAGTNKNDIIARLAARPPRVYING